MSLAANPALRSSATAPEHGASRVHLEESRRLSLTNLSLLALVVGVVTGFGAVGSAT